MDFKKDDNQNELGCSFLLERKQCISIEGRGDLFIKNTQTQVRELYRRKALNEPQSSSSSHLDSQLLKTSLQVDALHKKIENEIGKLKNFRHCFLKDDQTAQKQKLRGKEKCLSWRQKILRKREEKAAGKDTTVCNRLELDKIAMSSPDTDTKPFFRTMCVVSSPRSSDGEEQVPAAEIALDRTLLNDQQDSPTRMCGGCIFGNCNNAPIPCSVYQSDYGGECDCRLSRCPKCNPGICTCCGMAGAVAVPYSPNSSYQYPPGAFHTQYPTSMQQMASPKLNPCTCVRPSCSRRRTDLNIDSFFRNRNRSQDPLSSSSRSQKKDTEQVKWKSLPTNKCLPLKKKKENRDKIIKVSLKKQAKSNNTATGPPKEKMIIKGYMAVKSAPLDNDQSVDQEKLRLHREYMEMYQKEHYKTASKDSNPDLSELDSRPTYTKLPSEGSTLPELRTSYIKANEFCECEQEMYIGNWDDRAKNQNTKIVQSKTNVQQTAKVLSAECENRESKAQDKFQKCTLSVKRNVVRKTSSCQTDEIICLPRPSDKNMMINRSLSPFPWQLSKQSVSMSNQSSQTSPQIPMSPGLHLHVLSNQFSQSQTQSLQQISTQTNIQDTAKTLRASPERQAPYQLTNMGQGWVPIQQISNTQTMSSKTDYDTVNSVDYINSIQSFDTQQPLGITNQNDPYICSLRNAFEQKFCQPATNAHVPTVNSLNYPAPDTSRSPQKYVQLPEMTSPRRQSPQMSHHYAPVGSTKQYYDDCNCPSSTYEMQKSLTAMYTGPSSSSKFLNKAQFNSPTVSNTSELTSFLENPHLNNNTRHDGPSAHLNTEVVVGFSNTIPSSNFPNPSPVLHSTLNCTDQSVPDYYVCYDSPNVSQLPESGTSILKNSEYNSYRQQPHHNYEPIYEKNELVIRTQESPTRSTVSEKRTRSVTFEDESCPSGKSNSLKSCRSVINWEQVHQKRAERDNECAQPEEIAYSDNDDLIDSFRSSSTADTEFTCNESNYEDDYVTCNESRTNSTYKAPPPFNGCPCMYNEYLKLAALCSHPERF